MNKERNCKAFVLKCETLPLEPSWLLHRPGTHASQSLGRVSKPENQVPKFGKPKPRNTGVLHVPYLDLNPRFCKNSTWQVSERHQSAKTGAFKPQQETSISPMTPGSACSSIRCSVAIQIQIGETSCCRAFVAAHKLQWGLAQSEARSEEPPAAWQLPFTSGLSRNRTSTKETDASSKTSAAQDLCGYTTCHSPL